jgi:hypothetical protein
LYLAISLKEITVPIRSNYKTQPANLSSRLQGLFERLMNDRGERSPPPATPSTAFAARTDRYPQGDQGRALRLWMIARLRAGRMAPEHAAATI